MKTRTSIRAGGKGCSPEAEAYMQKALQMETKISNCIKRQGTIPPYQPGPQPPYPYIPPSTPPSSGYVYPDRSGWCG